MNTKPDPFRSKWMSRFYNLARRYGVEDIDPRELLYAIEARDARGETPDQVVKFLGWAEE